MAASLRCNLIGLRQFLVAENRMAEVHGCINDWSDSPAVVAIRFLFPSFRFGKATVILVSGEALDDARVEKVAEGLERRGR